jgi:hypothetical protein
MADNERSAALPVLVSLGLTVLALVVNCMGSFWRGSLLGALLAVVGTGVGCYVIVQGVQSKTQGKLLLGMLGAILGGVVATALVILRVISWLH